MPRRKRVSAYFEDNHSILCLKIPIDGKKQFDLLKDLRQIVLTLKHHALLARHPGVTRMVEELRLTYYWLHMAVDCYTTARQCPHCALNRIQFRGHTSRMILFPATFQFQSVALDLLGQLPKIEHMNHFLLVATFHFTKLTQIMPLVSIRALEMVVAFCISLILNYGTPDSVLSDNSKKFAAQLFQSICRHLCAANRITTSNHPQANGQIERFNRTTDVMLRSYVNENQDDCDRYLGALMYAYTCSMHSSTGTIHFELLISRPPPHLSQHPSLSFRARSAGCSKDIFLRILNDTIRRAHSTL